MAKIKSDAEFQAESDAGLLAEGDVIQQTPRRLAAAKKAAKRLAAESQKRTTGLKKVARAPGRKHRGKKR